MQRNSTNALVRIALTLALLACGDSPATPVPVVSVTVSPIGSSVIVGALQQFTAAPKDAQGAALTSRAVIWSTTNPAVATVSSSGMVSTLSPGTVDIRATSEGVVGSATFTVLPPPVASVVVTLPSASAQVGAVVQATATPRDDAGNALSGRAVVWSTSNAVIATVDATGRVTAAAPGSVDVIATSEGQRGTATFTVVRAAPSIASVTPATLVPGGTATIVGAGFDASLGGASVTIRGAPAPIVSITTSQIVVTVPCVESGAVDVRVTNAGSAPATRTANLAVTQRAVALGQALVLTSSAAAACNELAAIGGPAKYLVVVFSAATSQNTVSAFELSGNTPPAGIAAPLRTVATPVVAPQLTVSAQDAFVERHDRQHFAMLERNRADYVRLMAKMRSLPKAVRHAPPAQRASDVAVGDMRSIYYVLGASSCDDTTRVIRAKAIRIGSRSVIWEDSANMLQSGVDAALAEYYGRLGQIFDQEQYESVKRNFGDPLLRDAVTDDDGKIAMVFSQRLNGSAAAAYVTSCDQAPVSVARASNFGQFFYGQVPISAGSNVNSTNFPDGWFYFMVRTVIHEVKHIASHSARFAKGPPVFEESWLEEGSARQAEELWVRESLHHVAWKANTGFGTAASNGMYCDFHPSDAICNANDPLRRPGFGVRRQFDEIRNKLLQPSNWSPYGEAAGQTGSVFYQTAWSLLRYTADRFATSDSTFFQTLTSASTTGVANLTAVAGASLNQLIGGWGLALFADDYPGLVAPSSDIQFPTWNLRNIYASLNAAPAWTARWNTPFPISPVPLSPGAFLAQIPSIRGGAHAYFELTGTFNSEQLLSLRANATTAPSTNLRIAITRLQ